MIEVRLRYGSSKRARFDVATDARADELRAMARDLVRAKTDPDRSKRILEDAATASAGELRAIQALVAELTAGLSAPRSPTRTPSVGETVAQYAERWFDDRERRGFRVWTLIEGASRNT
jgi:hypothetical protein